MKSKNLYLLIAASIAIWIVGCSKNNGSGPQAADPVQQTVTSDEFTKNVQETFGDSQEMPTTTNYNDLTYVQKAFDLNRVNTYDQILRWGRIVMGWSKTITYNQTSDSTADVNIDFTQTNAIFRVRGIVGPDTIVTNKPFTHPMHRSAKAVKGRLGWRLDEITGAYGKSVDSNGSANTNLEIAQVELAPISISPNFSTITITDPPTYYFKVGVARQITNHQVPVVNPGDSVKVTIWVTNGDTTNIVVLHYGAFLHPDGFMRKARKKLIHDPARDAEVPGTMAFSQSYKVHRLPNFSIFNIGGKFHLALDVMTRGTVWQNDNAQPDYPYRSVAYIMPYYVIR